MQRCFVQSSAVLDTLCTRWRDPTDVQRQTSPRIDDPTETTQERGASERVREGERERGRGRKGARRRVSERSSLKMETEHQW